MTPSPQVSIRRGVYFAAVDGEGILLDLSNNSYIGLSATSARIWSEIAAGVPIEGVVATLRDSAVVTGLPPEDLVAHQLAAWRRAGLVDNDRDASSGMPDARSPSPTALAAVNQTQLDATPISFALGALLLRADLFVTRRLRRIGLAALLREIQAAKARGCRDPSRVLYATLRAYVALRRLHRQGKADCMHRSLVLATALRWRGIDATLGLGVRKFPFAAHAWVEALGIVVNDTPGVVERYTVIARF